MVANELKAHQDIASSFACLFNMCRVDPRAVTEDIDYTPLEIAASKENTKAFDLLAPRYEESIKKKIAQLFIWGLTDKAPSAAFMLLFESVPLAEVKFEREKK